MNVDDFDPETGIAQFSGPEVQVFASLIVELFYKLNTGGKNYVEMRVANGHGEEFILNFQRVAGKTPAQLLQETKAALRDAIKEIEEHNSDYHWHTNETEIARLKEAAR